MGCHSALKGGTLQTGSLISRPETACLGGAQERHIESLKFKAAKPGLHLLRSRRALEILCSDRVRFPLKFTWLNSSSSVDSTPAMGIT